MYDLFYFTMCPQNYLLKKLIMLPYFQEYFTLIFSKLYQSLDIYLEQFASQDSDAFAVLSTLLL